MSESYRAIGWNPFKRYYDLTCFAGVALYLLGFLATAFTLFPKMTPEIAMIRATGSAAFMLLHVVLCVGPLARLDSRFLPVLYNRRHLGVMTFLVGLVHAALVVLTYHVGSDMNPLLGIFLADAGRDGSHVPFQAFGFVALGVLFLMASTSHDFWLVNLTAPVWKSLHMLVYFAYAVLVAHVVFGVLQAESDPVYVLVLGVSVVLVVRAAC